MKIKRKDLNDVQHTAICKKYVICSNECPLYEDFAQCSPLENTSPEFEEKEIEVEI